MINCPNCNEVHPEYFLNCPKCGHDKNNRSMGSDKSMHNNRKYRESHYHYEDLAIGKFIAPRLTKLMLWLAVVIGGIFTTILSVIVSSIPQLNQFLKIFLIGSAIFQYLFAIAFFRIGYELVIVFFRIERNTSKQ